MSLRGCTYVTLEGGRNVPGMGIPYSDAGLPYG